jgi:hypothetical protein
MDLVSAMGKTNAIENSKRVNGYYIVNKDERR